MTDRAAQPTGAPPLLEIKALTVSYGPVVAVRDVDLVVGQRQCACLLGANGAGKSSLLGGVMGIAPVRSGTVTYKGRDVSEIAIEDRVKAGIALCPEGRKIFARLSVEENLRLAGAGLDRDLYRERLDWVLSLFPVLKQRLAGGASFLSGGQQQQLAIGRALMRKPDLLMLDEPSLGLDPIMTSTVFDTIAELRQDLGLAILLVEQNAERALALADQGYVMSTGTVVMQGPAATLPVAEIEEAYLGIEADPRSLERDT